jgi:hypothetical protein
MPSWLCGFLNHSNSKSEQERFRKELIDEKQEVQSSEYSQES